MTISLEVIEPGLIGNYSDLVTKVADWMDRDDLADKVPDFIALLEARLNRLLRTVMQETQATWAVTSGTYDLPTDFRSIRWISYASQPNSRLSEVAPAQLENWPVSGTPTVFAISGRSLVVKPAPTVDAPLALTAAYYRRIPPLGSFQPTNWLLDEHPDIYVWGALHQGAIYIRDPEAENACANLLDQAIAELKQASVMDQYGGPLSPRTTWQVNGARC